MLDNSFGRLLSGRSVLDELKSLCDGNGGSGNSVASAAEKRVLKHAELTRKYLAEGQKFRDNKDEQKAESYTRKAESSFAKLIEQLMKPNEPNADLFMEIARLFEEADCTQQAQGTYLKAIEAFNGSSENQVGFYRELGESYINQGKKGKARSLYLKAAANLDEREVAELGIYPELAELKLERGELPQALEFSQKGVAVSPMNGEARKLFAKTYHALGEYEHARSQWEVALALEPNDWESLQGIAGTYWDRGVLLRDRKERWKAFTRVVDILNNALDALDVSQDSATVGFIHFWLGRFHGDLRNYDEATHHFNCCKLMRYRPLETQVQMGFNYAEVKAYDEAEDSFKAAIELVGRSKKLRNKLGNPFDKSEEYPANYVLAVAHVGLATTLATRCSRLGQSLELANRGASLIKEVSKKTSDDYCLAAFLHECLGQICLGQDKVDEAIGEFNESIKVRTNGAFGDGRAYYYLARAYVAKARQRATESAKLLSLARDNCTYAGNASVRGVYEEEIAALLQEIDGLEAPPRTTQAAATILIGTQQAALQPLPKDEPQSPRGNQTIDPSRNGASGESNPVEGE